MAFGPAAGLEMVDALRDEPALAGYHLLPAVRGDLLVKLGRRAEARAELERAAALTRTRASARCSNAGRLPARGTSRPPTDAEGCRRVASASDRR